MLYSLAKKDNKWRNFALKLCNDKMLADDIVQEMYLKAYSYKKQLNDSYVYMIIKSLFIDHVRRNNTPVSIEQFHYLTDKNSNFEPTDEEAEILERFNSLDWKQKELIEESYYKSLREIEKEFPLINYGYAHRQIHKGLKKVLKDNYDKYKNSNYKRLR